MYDMIIIGGGASALAAAYYATGKKLNIAVISADIGGKVGWLERLTGADSQQYMPGNELAHLLASRVTAPGHAVIQDRVTAVSRHDAAFCVETRQSGRWEGRTVLVATGASPQVLGVPGEERLTIHGLGYSITTYAHLVLGRRIAVIGANARALAGAAELARTAQHVVVIAPEPVDTTMPIMQTLRRQPNVEFLEGYQVTEFVGQRTVEEIGVVRDGQQQRIAVHGVFVALGLIPHSEMVRDLVETDDQGFIRVNAAYETSVPGLYAAGDVSTKLSEQVLVAIGDGAQAARSAYEYLLAQWLLQRTADA